MAESNLSREAASPRGESAAPAPQVEGLVVALAPGLFEVAVGGTIYLCTLRGRLRKPRPSHVTIPGSRARPPFPSGRPTRGPSPHRMAPPLPATPVPDATDRPVRISPGDRVLMTPLSHAEGVIEEVLPRKAVLSRARPEVGGEHIMLANPDQAILVFATLEPGPNFRLLDRYLALCEHATVPALLCLNKMDLGLPREIDEAAKLYASLGYPVLRTSATTGLGLEALRERLIGRLSLLTGPSGVGKSSLMNALLPEADQRIGDISQATGKGRHTTTGARLLPLPDGGWLADTAGIRELALWNVPAADLPRCFIELRPVADACLYEGCTHAAAEEGCALREALGAGRITPSRFASFERLLEAARSEEVPHWALPAH
ncbi:MAG: ribosome small subunit-dependent GTPase A [Ktedonobacterales bacterium]|nr:ribosome small subunit-dependent GTPase A [Ktedonobacterales bacterium]